jgi:hypothetical protein
VFLYRLLLFLGCFIFSRWGDNMTLIYKHPTGGKLYQAGAKEIPEILRSKNISLLVLAATEYQPDHISNTGGNFVAAEVIYVPLKDTILFTPREFKQTIDKAKKVAAHVITHIENGNNVLSTCWAGLNRSGLISGLAMRQLSKAPGKKVAKQIRNRRSWKALSNPLFARVVVNS